MGMIGEGQGGRNRGDNGRKIVANEGGKSGEFLLLAFCFCVTGCLNEETGEKEILVSHREWCERGKTLARKIFRSVLKASGKLIKMKRVATLSSLYRCGMIRLTYRKLHRNVLLPFLHK